MWSEPKRGQVSGDSDAVTLFLCGDVMTGRGIDQVLPYPGDPTLCEAFANSALRYVELAEAANGRIPRPVAFSYIWGEALEEMARLRPAVRIANLETSITDRGECLPKGINYRMSRKNSPCLSVGGIDCCVLANNHILDWGDVGLRDTLDVLAAAGIKAAGAGPNAFEASQPAVLDIDGQRRIIVLGLGLSSSGIPESWRATERRPGVNLVSSLSVPTIEAIASRLRGIKRHGDIVVASIHWGGNWGYEIPERHIGFAHALIEMADVDIVHGHSSHHAQAMEVHKGCLILYGCGDFINDYEGIGGYEAFRSDLALAYFPAVLRSGQLAGLQIVPFRIHRFRLVRVQLTDRAWLADRLSREGKRFHTRVRPGENGTLFLEW